MFRFVNKDTFQCNYICLSLPPQETELKTMRVILELRLENWVKVYLFYIIIYYCKLHIHSFHLIASCVFRPLSAYLSSVKTFFVFSQQWGKQYEYSGNSVSCCKSLMSTELTFSAIYLTITNSSYELYHWQQWFINILDKDFSICQQFASFVRVTINECSSFCG
jgi:hypothetical protein